MKKTFIQCGDEQETLFRDIIGPREIPELMEITDLDRLENLHFYRCIWAKAAIEATDTADDVATGIVDLLANLRHLCDHLNIDFDDLDRIAEGHWDDETKGFLIDGPEGAVN
jgi:hypothetical protein